MCALEILSDLEENHGRHVTLRYFQGLSEMVATIAQVTEESWEYKTPNLLVPISTVGISLDGAYVLMHDNGYREAMVGSISLFYKNGDRQHSTYVGTAPEYVGIADGAKSNGSFLSKHTDKQILDFYHVSEYLSKVDRSGLS